ncbi:MAG TPA: metallophosphoesterase family protein [Candidatus Krumholzibacteria bacterium]|nr:metallophosphoesterase family protein [Candidatus Krumholzibacteria bacterium]
MKTVVGVISDTHGLLRPEALTALAGSDRVIHAGDVGEEEILEALRAIAPLTVVRGNVDTQAWCSKLPYGDLLEVDGVRIYVVHDLGTLDIVPASAGVSVVVFGHSHHPDVFTRNGITFFNPGSAGPRRFRLPVTVGRIDVEDGRARAKIVELNLDDD